MASRRLLILSGQARRADSLRALLSLTPRAEVLCAPSEPAFRDAFHQGACAVFLDADEGAFSSLALCREIRAQRPWGSCAVVLFGSGPRNAEAVKSLDAGADDFWSYPFNESVCRAYLRALLRRLSSQDGAQEVVEARGLSLDPSARKALLKGREIALRAKEFDLLLYMMKSPGKALSREDLLREVWGYEENIPTRTVDFHISQLRKKLRSSGTRIETVAGTGYRFSGR